MYPRRRVFCASARMWSEFALAGVRIRPCQNSPCTRFFWHLPPRRELVPSCPSHREVFHQTCPCIVPQLHGPCRRCLLPSRSCGLGHLQSTFFFCLGCHPARFLPADACVQPPASDPHMLAPGQPSSAAFCDARALPTQPAGLSSRSP